MSFPLSDRSIGRVTVLGCVAVSACLLVLERAAPVSGQRISGQLLDLGSEAPIAAGLLTLRTADGVPLLTAVTDREGYWTLNAPAAGSYFIDATRIGYEPWVAGPIQLAADSDLNALYHLRRRPVRLAPIEVTAEALRRYLEQAGFYERQRTDFGHYLAPDDIDRRAATHVTDLLVGLPGVQMVSAGGGSVGGRQIQLRGSNLSQGGLCRPRIFVDGLMYARGDSRPVRQRGEIAVEERLDDAMQRLDEGMNLDNIGPAADILAIEVYRSAAQVPVRFGGSSVETLCGVIVLWTRRGGLTPGR